MKIRLIIIVLSFFIFSCEDTNKKNNEENIRSYEYHAIKSKELLSTLDSFLIKSPIRRTEPPNSILMYLYIKEKDTIIDLFDKPLFECKNLVGTINYKSREIYFFSEGNLKGRLGDLVELSNKNNINCEKRIDTSSFYVSYQESFTLKNGLLKRK